MSTAWGFLRVGPDHIALVKDIVAYGDSTNELTKVETSGADGHCAVLGDFGGFYRYSFE